MAITEWEIRRTAIGQSNISIILCDDDPVFLAELRSEIQRTFAKLNMKVALSTFTSPAALTPELLAACDMAFLDKLC